MLVEEGVAMEEMLEAVRKVSYVSVADAIRLAQLGVLQKELWV